MQDDVFEYRPMTRRRFLSAGGALAASSALAACTTARPAIPYAPEPLPPPAFEPLGDYATMYGPMTDDGFNLPAIPYQKIDPQFLRQIVPDPTGARPGTVVVDTASPSPLRRARRRHGAALRRRARPRRLRMVGRRGHPVEAALAEMDAAGRDGGARPEARALQRRQWRHAGRPGKSARRAGAVSVPQRRGHALSPARLAGMEFDRQVGVVGLRAPDQPGRHRSLRPRAQPDAGDRDLRCRRRVFGRRHSAGRNAAFGRPAMLPPLDDPTG